MVVVADSTPLIYLSRVGVLDVLATLFGEVVIPKAVSPLLDDLVAQGFRIAPPLVREALSRVGES